MSRFALTAALLLVAPGALAQAVTRPVVTASAGYLRGPDFYDDEGNAEGGNSTLTAFSLRLGAEAPVYRRDRVTVSGGGRLSAASLRLENLGGGGLRLQSVEAYGRVGTRDASVLLGASLDLGKGLYEQSDSFHPNSDGQNAVFAQLRGEIDAGPACLFAEADGALTFTSRSAFTLTAMDGRETDIPVDIDNGDLFGVQVGASASVGPLEVGLAAFYAGRTDGTYSLAAAIPDGFPTGFPATQPIQTPYEEALGIIPSVSYRAPGGRLVVRAEGAVSGFALMENTPVGFTLSGKNGWTTRPAVTLSASVGL